jgi:hypothetical protein
MSALLLVLLLTDKGPDQESRDGKDSEAKGKPSHPVELIREPLENMPVPVDGIVRIAYTCSGSAELTGAVLLYRINGKEWHRVPLKMQAGEGKGQGKFNWRIGGFEGSSDPVEFYVPSTNPQVGGGRFDFETRPLGLKAGDSFDFQIQVTDRKKQVLRSELRRKNVVTVIDFQRWLLSRLEHN